MVSKLGSPAANRMTGTPACTRTMAWSVMATIFEGLTELTRKLRETSTSTWVWSLLVTASVITTHHLDLLFLLLRRVRGSKQG
ncbi:hypothetical protein ACFXTN_027689 [Malus domestica]